MEETHQEEEVKESVDDVVRREAIRLLRAGTPGQFFCALCLVRLIQDALKDAYTRGHIDRALALIARSPGPTLSYQRSVVCDRCGRTAPCLGAKQPPPRGTSGA